MSIDMPSGISEYDTCNLNFIKFVASNQDTSPHPGAHPRAEPPHLFNSNEDKFCDEFGKYENSD